MPKLYLKNIFMLAWKTLAVMRICGVKLLKTAELKERKELITVNRIKTIWREDSNYEQR